MSATVCYVAASLTAEDCVISDVPGTVNVFWDVSRRSTPKMKHVRTKRR
jgi:hypothetical protein